MNINAFVDVFLLVFLHYVYHTYAHSASSSSALATSSLKFKNPKLEKDNNLPNRKEKLDFDDEDLDDEDGSKFEYFSSKYYFVFEEPQLNSEETRLRRALLRNYVPEARPVINRTTVTVVDVGLTIIQVMHLVSKNEYDR